MDPQPSNDYSDAYLQQAINQNIANNNGRWTTAPMMSTQQEAAVAVQNIVNSSNANLLNQSSVPHSSSSPLRTIPSSELNTSHKRQVSLAKPS